jgi:hypothetical protein
VGVRGPQAGCRAGAGSGGLPRRWVGVSRTFLYQNVDARNLVTTAIAASGDYRRRIQAARDAQVEGPGTSVSSRAPALFRNRCYDDLRRHWPTALDDALETAVAELAPLVGVRAACRAVGRSQDGHYRRHRQPPPPAPASKPARRPQPRALTPVERQQVRAVLNSPDFVDQAPAAVYHTLLDEGVYLVSPSTMYRILREHGEVHERRRLATHPAHVKPERFATAPNRVWTWDITRLRGRAGGTSTTCTPSSTSTAAALLRCWIGGRVEPVLGPGGAVALLDRRTR